jgi:hypothetical protein
MRRDTAWQNASRQFAICSLTQVAMLEIYCKNGAWALLEQRPPPLTTCMLEHAMAAKTLPDKQAQRDPE